MATAIPNSDQNIRICARNEVSAVGCFPQGCQQICEKMTR
ncbi:hypothetical protein CGRA01v4_09603 [Colletotrichum graminicola]|nr:hypothetical protein CGRA01v4_09603 [Colletotrichum graminicola]